MTQARLGNLKNYIEIFDLKFAQRHGKEWTTEVVITPEVAGDMLVDLNWHNRTITRSNVNEHVMRMEAGEHETSLGLPLIISERCSRTATGKVIPDKSGERLLIDGQHRLSAVVKFGKPVRFVVVFDAAPKVQKGVDNGKVRNAKDRMEFNGAKDPAAKTSIIRVSRYFRGLSRTSYEVEREATLRDAELAPFVCVARPKTKNKAIPKKRGAEAAAFFDAHAAGLADIVTLATRFTTGVRLAGNDPLIALDDALSFFKGQEGGEDIQRVKYQLVEATIKAVNARQKRGLKTELLSILQSYREGAKI